MSAVAPGLLLPGPTAALDCRPSILSAAAMASRAALVAQLEPLVDTFASPSSLNAAHLGLIEKVEAFEGAAERFKADNANPPSQEERAQVVR